MNKHSLFRNPPRSERQALELECRRLDKAPEGDDTNHDTKDVDNIVAIGSNIAGAAAIDANVSVVFKSTGKWLCDQVAFEVCGCVGGGDAGCGGEHVDEFENEETRECAA
jgi:hypothetical protein